MEKISIIGAGYVGLVTAACLSNQGHHVVCVDTNEGKINLLKKAISPIYEQGLQELIEQGLGSGRLRFTTNLEEGIHHSEALFIAVGTPSCASGDADLDEVYSVFQQIIDKADGHKWIIIKSTIPVGTGMKLQGEEKDIVIRSNRSDYQGSLTYEVISNPEFMRQGSAVQDFLSPDRIIIGVQTEQAFEVMQKIYSGIEAPLLKVNVNTAELIKYASNAFLAAKISYINMLANLCEQVDANIEHVAEGMGLDQRIGRQFLNAGIGFGGSCLPKDVKALLQLGKNYSVDLPIIEAALYINEKRAIHFVELIEKVVQPETQGVNITCWGAAFKAGTDDLRESPALEVIRLLNQRGYQITVYDPMIKGNEHPILENLKVADNLYDSIKNQDGLVILTEWADFYDVEWSYIFQQMGKPLIFDGRNMLNHLDLTSLGFQYYSVGSK